MSAAHQQRVSPLVSGTVLAATLLAGHLSAFIVETSLDISQYAHTTCRVRDGFAKGTISSIAQTPDGYLWLGTDFGLLRFDGVRAVPWQPPPGERLPSNSVFNLLAARDGTLWIATSKGLASWKDGKLTTYPELLGQTIRAPVVEDQEGTIWVGGLALPPPGKLCAIQKGTVQCYGDDGAFGNGSRFGLYEDSHRNLWVGLREGVWHWKPGPPKFYSAQGPGNGIQGLAEGDDGALLFGPRTGIKRVVGEKIDAYPLPSNVPEFTAARLLRDRDGNLWIGTSDRGLVHVHGTRTDLFTQADGLSGDLIETLFIDREGDVWVATDGGLDRFREFSVPTVSLKQGLSNASILSVLADWGGSVWLSTRRGLNKWQHGEITIFGRDGLLNGNYAGSMFQDGHGRIWASTLREFGYLEDARFVAVRGIPGGPVYSITEGSPGNLWIANKDFGLIHLLPDRRVEQTPWNRLGHKDYALALAFDPVKRGLWVGFYQGGVVYFEEGKVRESYSAADGLGAGRVNGLRFDPDGTLWAATEGGLSRLKGNRFATLSSKNGLPCDSVHWEMADNDHSLWLYTSCGLVRLDRSELNAWANAVDNKRDTGWTIHPTVFDASEGVRTLDDNGGYTPHVAKSSDGDLWFLPSDGTSVIDPRHLSFNRLPPPVQIEEIAADHKTYFTRSNGSEHLRLPPLSRDLEIDYTALSFVAPEKVRFRYKLEGHDSDWQDVGNRRQAFYNDLPPRHYRFRVAAANNSGVWNEAGAFMDFEIAPAYYQTTWFRLSSLAALVALLGVFYQLRIRYMADKFSIRLEERLNERTRIARDFHDTLLQSFQGVLLKFSALKYLIRDRPAEAEETLEHLLEQARQAVSEGRDAVQGLRSSTVVANDLALAITTFGKQLTADPTGQSYPEFAVRMEGRSRDLPPIIRDEVYRIARESVSNAFRHAHARRIAVEIRYDPRQFRLRVADDGMGIDPAVLSAGGRAGHHGLPGIKERAELAGGKLTVWSQLNCGTEIELTIPASIAYTKSTPSDKPLTAREGNG